MVDSRLESVFVKFHETVGKRERLRPATEGWLGVKWYCEKSARRVFTTLQLKLELEHEARVMCTCLHRALAVIELKFGSNPDDRYVSK